MPESASIYLDYAASAPIDPRVAESMWACLTGPFGSANPSADHSLAGGARELIATAAAQVASLAGTSADAVIWTSGATEANNLGILGAARYLAPRGRHVVTVKTEHKSVLACFEQLEREGFEVDRLEPDRHGHIGPAAIARVLRPDTTLLAVMHANNETGVVQDIAAIGALCRAHGVLLHVDAAQSAGKLPLDLQAQQIDLLALTAHKLCGPKGIGALILNPATVRRVQPLLFGGGQQRGLRPGTLPTHQIVGMGEAFRLAAALMADEVPRLAALRDRLWQGLALRPGISLNGDPASGLCSILNVTVQGVHGESLRYALRDIALSRGSACDSAVDEPSYVLRNLGRSVLEAEASLRFSVGRFTTAADIDQAIDRIHEAVRALRALSTRPAGVC